MAVLTRLLSFFTARFIYHIYYPIINPDIKATTITNTPATVATVNIAFLLKVSTLNPAIVS